MSGNELHVMIILANHLENDFDKRTLTQYIENMAKENQEMKELLKKIEWESESKDGFKSCPCCKITSINYKNSQYWCHAEDCKLAKFIKD